MWCCPGGRHGRLGLLMSWCLPRANNRTDTVCEARDPSPILLLRGFLLALKVFQIRDVVVVFMQAGAPLRDETRSRVCALPAFARGRVACAGQGHEGRHSRGGGCGKGDCQRCQQRIARGASGQVCVAVCSCPKKAGQQAYVCFPFVRSWHSMLA